MAGRLWQSSLSPVEAQRRADMWLRLGNTGMTLVIAVVAYSIRRTEPVASQFLWIAVAGFVVIMIADYVARFLPSK